MFARAEGSRTTDRPCLVQFRLNSRHLSRSLFVRMDMLTSPLRSTRSCVRASPQKIMLAFRYMRRLVRLPSRSTCISGSGGRVRSKPSCRRLVLRLTSTKSDRHSTSFARPQTSVSTFENTSTRMRGSISSFTCRTSLLGALIGSIMLLLLDLPTVLNVVLAVTSLRRI